MGEASVANRRHTSSNLSSQFEAFSSSFHVKHSTRPWQLVSGSSSDQLGEVVEGHLATMQRRDLLDIEVQLLDLVV